MPMSVDILILAQLYIQRKREKAKPNITIMLLFKHQWDYART